MKAIKCMVDVCVCFNGTGIGKESKELLERKGRTVRYAIR